MCSDSDFRTLYGLEMISLGTTKRVLKTNIKNDARRWRDERWEMSSCLVLVYGFGYFFFWLIVNVRVICCAILSTMWFFIRANLGHLVSYYRQRVFFFLSLLFVHTCPSVLMLSVMRADGTFVKHFETNMEMVLVLLAVVVVVVFREWIIYTNRQ